MNNSREHALKDHGYKQEDIMTLEMKEKIRQHIRRS
jgi:predicted small metal-binding protein